MRLNQVGMCDSYSNNTAIIPSESASVDQKLKQQILEVKDTFEAFRRSTNNVKMEVNKLDNFVPKNKEVLQNTFTALGFVVPLRRISSLPDKLDNKDYIGTTGALAIAGILLPEDLRDTRDGARQVIHKILPESIQYKIQKRFPKFYENFINYAPKYNQKECQTPFSFIRGSFLEKPINKHICNKYGHALYEWDKPLIKTKLGEKIMNLLKVKDNGWEFTKRNVKRVVEDEGKYIVADSAVNAIKFKGSKVGKLICRALNRTTKFGAIALSAICLPSIIKAFVKPEKPQEKLVNGSKQALKSTISVVSTLSGIGLIGALLAPIGPAGSVAGMAIGSAIGAYISTKINNIIKTEN